MSYIGFRLRYPKKGKLWTMSSNWASEIMTKQRFLAAVLIEVKIGKLKTFQHAFRSSFFFIEVKLGKL